jgi:esterase/lipase
MEKTKATFFILPGFGQQASGPEYRWLIKLLETKGFKVFAVPVKWKYRTNTDVANDFIEFYDRHKSSINYVLGFSYGAVVALMTANELRPNKIYLCSLSPDFKEDTIKMKPWVQRLIGKKRLADTQKRSGKKLASELKVPSIVFYGEEEAQNYPQLKFRCEETVRLANKSKLVIVKSSPHKIDHPNYIEAIKKELS